MRPERGAWRAAHRAERAYLAAVSRQEPPERLAELAGAARDLWTAVTVTCALGEEAARDRTLFGPLGYRRPAWLRSMRIELAQWAALADDAAARCDLFAALEGAHHGPISIVEHRDAI
jgi:hypothetical protein